MSVTRRLLVSLICLGLFGLASTASSGNNIAFADSKPGGVSIGFKSYGQNENIEEIYNGLAFVGYPVTDRVKVGIYIYVTINRNKNNIQTNLNINRDTAVFGLQMRF